jgi:hypothetical protein
MSAVGSKPQNLNASVLIRPPPKQLVPKPMPIRVDHIGLAVICDLLDSAALK